ncbi:carbohydrate ABC transporter permease [Halostella sp. PRR32]|uniref:carbohydrate ABC transporter permease n=1 Tax=Halostella sp. PRR32 TaxID=3098147 RepID=UPI002B1E5776|nr:carbohydrate ABC transporter permease [Halostella sp. PRR32]
MRSRLIALRYHARDRLRAARRYPERTAARAATVVTLATSAAFIALPLYWLFSAAFRPQEGIEVPPPLFPGRVTFDNLTAVLAETAFPTYFVNSVVVSALTVVLAVVIATPAGYALSRYDLRYERAFMLAVLLVQMIPLLALVTPLYQLFAAAGLLDTLAVVIVTDTVMVVPVGIWLIKEYFDTLPEGLEEAARVGGATRLRAFLVVLPLARPAVGATAVFAFVVSWNQFVIPLTFTSSQAVWTFPVGLYEFISRRGVVNWPLLGAASLWAMVPVLVLVAAFQRQFVAGLSGRFGGGRR